MVDIVLTLIANSCLAIGCYVFGNMRAMRLIEYRERQAARLDAFTDPNDAPEPVYRTCLCSHQTTSHRIITATGKRGSCQAYTGIGAGGCACQGYMPDPKTRM